MAASTTSGAACETAISTNVPSSGLARRMLSSAVPIGGQYPFHALGHMVRRQRRARNVPDVLIHLQRAPAALAHELRKPARFPNLAAVRLPVLQNVHALDPSARVQGDGIVDVEVL